MVIKRRRLDDLRLGEGIVPVADPANVFHRPNIAQPELAPLVDLAPLSKTVQQFLVSKAAKTSERSAVAAETFFADPESQAEVLGLQERVGNEDDEAAAKRLKKRFIKLAEDGTIPEAANPAFQIRFAELAAGRAVGEYRNRLMSKVNQAAALVDPETGLPASQQPDIQALKDEAWGDLADNPAITNFFGSRIASPEKIRADEEFDHAVARVRGQEMEREARSWQANDVAVQVEQLVREGGDVAELSTRLQGQVGDVFVAPRALVMQGIELAAQRLAHGTPESAGDPEEALRLLDRVAGEVKVDGLTLGEDPATADRISRLQDLYEQEVGEQDIREARRLAARDALAQARVRERALSPLMDALRADESLSSVEQAIGLELEQLPDEERGAAFEALRNIRDAVESQRTSSPDSVRQIQLLMAQGAFEEASTALTAGLDSGALSPIDVLSFQDALESRSRDQDVLQGNRVYREGLGVLERSRSLLSGFTGDVAREANDLFEAALLDYTETAEDAVDSNGVVDTDAVRAAAQDMRKQLDTFVAHKETQRQEVFSAVRENAARLVDSDQLLEQALMESRITVEERDELRRISVQSSQRRSQLLQSTRQGIATAVLQSTALEEAGLIDIATGRPNASGLAVVEAQERAVRDSMDAWLSENAPKLPAERLQEAFDSRLRVVRDEQLSTFRELSPEQLRNRFGLSPAGVVRQVSQADLARNRVEADAVGAAIRAGQKNVMPESLRVEGVDGKVYRIYSDAVRGKLPTSEAAVSLFGLASVETDSEQRLEIVRLGLLSPADLLKGGKVQVRLSQEVRTDADRRLRSLLARQGSDAAVARTSALLKSVEVDLADAIIDPWTTPLFRDRVALREFGDGPDLPRLLERLGLEEADAADWLAQQMILTPR